MQPLKRIAITGASGQIAYSLIFRIANGELFGPHTPIALHLLEIPEMLGSLMGLLMELDDCAFPLLKEIKIGYDPNEIFGDIDLAVLVGAKPRGPGMERSDLMKDNAPIFATQGKALDQCAKKDVKVFVVGNPCNTNCLIARHQAKRISQEHFYAMMLLDQNRASHILAEKAKVDIIDVQNVIIWGNHSTTLVPDYFHATINGQAVTATIKDTEWLQQELFSKVQKRGAEVIKARGKSSAASAAHAALSSLKYLYEPTREGSWFSLAASTQNNSYGLDEDLIFGLPCRINRSGLHEVVSLELDFFLKEKIKLSEKELIEERNLIKHLL